MDSTRGEVVAVPFCVGVIPAASAVLLTLMEPGLSAGLLPPIPTSYRCLMVEGLTRWNAKLGYRV